MDPEDFETLREAYNFGTLLLRQLRHEEVVSLLRVNLPIAERTLGLDNELSMRLASLLAEGTFHASLARAGLNLKEAISHGATMVLPEDSTFDLRDEILGAAATLERVHSRARRVFGDSHPFTVHVLDSLGKTRTMVCSIDNSTITYIE